MNREKRAVQFSTFAMLTGYEDAMEEEARCIDDFAEITEGRQEEHKELPRNNFSISFAA